MSDCGVCVFSGFEGEDNEFMSEEIRKARKEYKCCECNSTILPGQKHEYARGANDGSFWAERTCLICSEIRHAFCCDGWWYGELWNGMREVMDQLNTSCYQKLNSPAARMELRRRWQEWKFSDSHRREVRRRSAAMIERALADGRRRMT